MDFLKHYRITLEAMGPVFVGSGNKLLKKEYVLDKGRKKAHIIDSEKMFSYFAAKGLLEEYEKFLLNSTLPFAVWLREKNISTGDIAKFTKYSLDCGDIAELNTVKDLLTFIKDPYGMPYIPGSTLKGALRNLLLIKELNGSMQIPDYRKKVDNYEFKGNPKRFLGNEIKEIETDIFHTLERDTRKEDAARSVMKGIIVGDSNPLPVASLTLCQKIDARLDGSTTDMPLVRECLKPGTKIEFQLAIDSQECPYKIDDIRDSVRIGLEKYNSQFLSKFTEEKPYSGDVMYIGGGVGYASKTITYPILGDDRRAVKTVSTIIENTLPQKVRVKHGHINDVKRGISPHICKLTAYEGELVQMGACRVEIN